MSFLWKTDSGAGKNEEVGDFQMVEIHENVKLEQKPSFFESVCVFFPLN